MTHIFNQQDYPPIATIVEQLSLLSTDDTPLGNEKPNTSCAQEINQHAQHAECNIGDETILSTQPGLPNEIMTLIFSYIRNSPSTLYACTLANKRCYDLVNPMLWKAPAIYTHRTASQFLNSMLDMSNHRCYSLCQLIHNLRAIYIPRTENNLPRLLSYMSNLQHLTLANWNAETAIRHLQHSRLTSLRLDKVDVTASGFDIIAQFPLEAFDWTPKWKQSPLWLTRLARCPLRRLSIDYNAISVKRNTLRNIQQRTASNMDRLPTTPFASFLTDPSTFPQLTFLNVRMGTDIHDAMLAAFFKNHPHLEQLHLSHQYITDATLDAMESLSHLKCASFTHMQHITSPAVRRLINDVLSPFFTSVVVEGFGHPISRNYQSEGWGHWIHPNWTKLGTVNDSIV